MSKGRIFNIQRFCWQDGPGIRTVVFFKGCPLNCIWCHNPESKTPVPELLFDSEKCINCGGCVSVCPNKCHKIENGKHMLSRTDCIKCFGCAAVCPSKALERCGNEISVGEILQTVLKDEEFYRQSGGGVTLSGGEPLMQYEFASELLSELKGKGISTAIETCGYTDIPVDRINRYCDSWLFDIKLLSEENHIKYTGVSNERILKNLYRLDSLGADIIIRCPVISDINLNSGHFHRLAELVRGLKNVSEIQVEPYDPFGLQKSLKIGKRQKYENASFLSEESLLPFIDILKKEVTVNVRSM